ncbi:MAG: T9SS type A sorting domain-containing protein [Flavobacteriales bacterium]|nr:T9SS type A sorting domain-containing protein [Flavobacteriales bacterium]
MKKAVLFIMVWVFVDSTQAQPTIEKYYQTGGSATLTISEQQSGNLFTGIGYSGFSIIDPQGNIIYSHYFDGLPLTVVQTVRKHTDNEIYFAAGYLVDSCTAGQGLGVDPVIGRMDSLGNILAVHRYQLNAVTCNNTAQDLTITSDGGAIAWGRLESFFALRVDPTGALLWSKQFARHGSFGFIRELSNGDMLAGINMDTAGAVLARMDANGNFLWCKSYIRPRGMVQDCIIESDSSFIITGYTDSIASTNGFAPLQPSFHPKLFMMKLDGTGNVQWCKGYEGFTTWYTRQGQRIVKTLDGNYALLANLNVQGYNLPSLPLLMKTDTNGDTLWVRSAGKSGYSYQTSSLLASSDGGILYNGMALGDFGSWSGASYLFKTDSLGHLPCFEKSSPFLMVYDLFPTDSSLTLTSVDGATAYPAYVQDTTYDAITVYDGCTFTTGIAQTLSHARPPKVHPNPSTGQFTVEFLDPLTVDSFYSVYDATGRLLFQRPLAQRAEKVEVDLSRYGKGMYLIRFSDRDGVCSERVVVE